MVRSLYNSTYLLCVHVSTLCILSNDPGKVDRNFFCYTATVLSPVGMFSFLHRECINLHGGRLRNKMHLQSTLKGFFCVLKDFNQSQEFKTITKKSLQFKMFPAHRISLLFKHRPDFVIWKMVGK